jgi:nucleotide-binding universal stress UspA family protein
MARRYGAKVLLLKVDEPQTMLGWDEIIDLDKYKEERDRQKNETEAYLATIQKKLHSKGIKTQALIKYNAFVIKEILKTAQSVEADIVAMASHGQTGLSRTFYGSVAAGVLSNIDRPLLLIRSRRLE